MSGIRHLPFTDVFDDASGGNVKTLQSDYQPHGRVAVVDQGKELIAGFTDNEEAVCAAAPPVIVFGDHTCIFKYIDFPFAMGADGVKVLKPKIEADTKYLFYCLRRIHLPDTGYDRHFKYLKRSTIPLPPLAEQKRIAAVLDKADDLRGKRRQALATLDTLLQSVFLDMFGDPVTKQSPHPIKPLRPYLSAQSGKSSDDVRTEQSQDIPIYGGNGVNGWATKALFDEPMIVVGRVGQQCGITRLTSGPSWVTDNAIAVRVVDHSKLHPVYVAAALQRSPLRATVQHLDLPFVNQSIILDQPLPLPPLALQRRFAGLTAAIEQRRVASEGAAARLDALFKSLQSAAFAGTLFADSGTSNGDVADRHSLPTSARPLSDTLCS